MGPNKIGSGDEIEPVTVDYSHSVVRALEAQGGRASVSTHKECGTVIVYIDEDVREGVKATVGKK